MKKSKRRILYSHIIPSMRFPCELDMKYKKLSVTMAVPILCRGCIGCPLSFGKVISDGILHRFSSVNCPLLWVMLWPSKYFPIHESIPFARECGKGWRSGWCWQGNLIETRLHMRDIKFAFTVKLIRKIRINGIWITAMRFIVKYQSMLRYSNKFKR